MGGRVIGIAPCARGGTASLRPTKIRLWIDHFPSPCFSVREASPEIIRVSRMVAKPSRHLPSAYYPLNRNTATLTLRYAILADDMDQRLVGRTRRDGVRCAAACVVSGRRAGARRGEGGQERESVCVCAR